MTVKHTTVTLSGLLLIVTAVATALTAGLFYAWSCSVTPGLALVDDATYITAFRAMNRAIQNPVFFATFMGTAVLLPVSAFLQYRQGTQMQFWLLLAASAVYLTGVMGVTVAGNVPMNDALDAFNLKAASVQDLAVQRANFEGPWNRLNTIRTLSSLVTIVLVILACMRGK
jgi:uncharacterized membrane protein